VIRNGIHAIPLLQSNTSVYKHPIDQCNAVREERQYLWPPVSLCSKVRVILQAMPPVRMGRLRALGVSTARRVVIAPEALAQYIRAERVKWAKAIKAGGIRPE